jgi:hypothetical protein
MESINNGHCVAGSRAGEPSKEATLVRQKTRVVSASGRTLTAFTSGTAFDGGAKIKSALPAKSHSVIPAFP